MNRLSFTVLSGGLAGSVRASATFHAMTLLLPWTRPELSALSGTDSRSTCARKLRISHKCLPQIERNLGGGHREVRFHMKPAWVIKRVHSRCTFARIRGAVGVALALFLLGI